MTPTSKASKTSARTFFFTFDIEGIVYVIGMHSQTINTLVKKKYGEESAVKGLGYLQKIVQLPFNIPNWKEADISDAISSS
jgi:hypothetical protein